MIKEAYCSLEVAKLLKEKGFDEPCRSAYIWNSEEYELCALFSKSLHFNREGGLEDYEDDSVPRISAPTHQMAMKWLREVHQLYISVGVSPIYGKVKDEKGRNTCGLLYWHYMASGGWMNDKYNPQQKAFVVSAKNYEEAVEASLKYSLENILTFKIKEES